MRIVARFGSTAIAGYSIAMRVVLFALLPSWGMANAAATLVGQNLGAGRPERAEQAVWRAALYNLVFLGCTGLLFVLFGEPIVRALHRPTRRSSATGRSALRIISAGFLFYAYGMVLTQAFNGAGDTWTPTLINLFCFWLWEIPLAWLLAGPLGPRPDRRVRRRAGRLLDDGGGQRRALPPRPLEARQGLTRAGLASREKVV